MGMPLRLFRYRLGIVLLALIALLAVSIRVFAPPAQAKACAAVFGVGVAGSGEPGASTGSMGLTSSSVLAHMAADLPAAVASQVKTAGLPYAGVDIIPGIVGGLIGGVSYQDSRDEGVSQLTAMLSSHANGCPNQLFVLAGLSQGADVIATTLSSLDLSTSLGQHIETHIAGVALFGDPRFDPFDNADLGSFDPAHSGIFKRWPTPPDIKPEGVRPPLTAYAGRLKSYCNQGDPICNYSFTNAVGCFGQKIWALITAAIATGVIGATLTALLDSGDYFKASCPHLHYRDGTVQAPAVNTAKAGARLAKQVLAAFAKASGWTQQAAITPPDPASNGNFGANVAISGSTMVTSDLMGSTYIYHYSGSSWILQNEFKNVHATDEYVNPVAISDNVIAVGDSDPISGGGVVRIYQQSGSTWTLATNIPDPAPSNNHGFGSELSFSGSTLFVLGNTIASSGPPYVDEVYVYQLTGTSWTLETTIQQPSSSDFNFGYGLASDGTTLAISYQTPPGVGTVNIYTGSGASWTLRQTLTEPGSTGNNIFGEGSIAIVGGALAIGDIEYQETGAVYLYSNSGGTWTQQGFLSPAGHFAFFGDTIGFASPNSVLIGAPQQGSGTTYAYSLSGSTWTQEAKIVPTTVNSWAQCGWSLGVSGTTAVIGCPQNGDTVSGKVYIFSS